MIISKILIENFRCFEKLELNLERLQVLVGENGTGKTAILEAIGFATSKEYAARKICEQDFNNLDNGEINIYVEFSRYFVIEVKDWSWTKNILCNGVKLKVKRREKSSPGKLLSDGFTIEHFVTPITYSSLNEIDADLVPKDYEKTNFPPSVNEITNGFKATRKTTGDEWQIQQLSLSIHGDLKGFPSVFYFDRHREVEAKVGYNSLFQKITRELNWRYRKKVNLQETIQNWEPYYKGVVGTVEDTKTHTYLGPLQDEIKKMLGRSYDSLEISLLNIEQPFTQAFFSLRNPTETNQIEFSGLGSGICTLIAYLLLKVVSSLSKEEVIFLIDEPELHLHPQAQSAFFGEFLNAKHQIIYTTHSDLFVSLKQWDNIIRVDRECNYFPTLNTLSTIKEGRYIKDHINEIKTFHQDETIYFRENNEIFFACKVLLVEGPAEKYGIPRLAAILGLDLNHITIISCNGKGKIPYYQQLCLAFGISFFTLLDLDNKQINEEDNKRPGEWAENNALAFFSSTFELLLGVDSVDDHKASNTLIKIDQISKKEDIDNQEIISAIENISKWAIQ